jgi:hypothetical protein
VFWKSIGAHLSCRYDLKRSEGHLQVGCVGLQVIEGAGDGRLELRGVLAGWAVSRNLVEGAHGYESALAVLELEVEIARGTFWRQICR